MYEITKFDLDLHRIGFKIDYNPPMDGNCFFGSVLHQMNSITNTTPWSFSSVQALRNKVVAHLSELGQVGSSKNYYNLLQFKVKVFALLYALLLLVISELLVFVCRL